MKARTYRERLEMGLSRAGYHRVPGGTLKYSTWRKYGDPLQMFVGKNGALRRGLHISDSRSVCDAAYFAQASALGQAGQGYKIYKRLLELGDGQQTLELEEKGTIV